MGWIVTQGHLTAVSHFGKAPLQGGNSETCLIPEHLEEGKEYDLPVFYKGVSKMLLLAL